MTDVPFSQEAEQALIGSVLISPGWLSTISVFMSPDDFFINRHRVIWLAMLRLAKRRDAIDYFVVSEEIKAMQPGDDCGGTHYLLECKVMIDRQYVVDEIYITRAYYANHAKHIRAAILRADQLKELNPEVVDR